MENLTFWEYCKKNAMWFVAMGFCVGLATVSFALGETGGVAAGIFFSAVGIIALVLQVNSYRKL